MANKLEGKTAIVTGAGRGIGREVALLFAREGARVIVNDIGASVAGEGADASPAEQVVSEIKAFGGEAQANYNDVADMDGAEGLLRQAVDAWGRADILVNVAGILRERMVFNMTGDEWDAVVRVHMRGTFATTKFASILWRQQRQGGRLINFTSGAGLFGSMGQPNYSAAKLGIVGFTYSCARALSKYGVAANCIAPTAMTRMTAQLPPDRAAAIAADAAGATDPAHVALPTLYLASDEGYWINGRVIGVRGPRIVLYSNYSELAVLNGARRWEVDELFPLMEDTFGVPLAKPGVTSGLGPMPLPVPPEA